MFSFVIQSKSKQRSGDEKISHPSANRQNDTSLSELIKPWRLHTRVPCGVRNIVYLAIYVNKQASVMVDWLITGDKSTIESRT